MTYLGRGLNDFSNPTSRFRCDTCSGDFTIDPEPPEDERWMWQNCMAPECDSFDISRDVGCIVGFGWSELKGDKGD